MAALAASGLLGGGTEPVVLPNDDTPAQSQTVFADGEEVPQTEDSSRLDPNALIKPGVSLEGTEVPQDQEPNGDTGQTQNGDAETGQEPASPASI